MNKIALALLFMLSACAVKNNDASSISLVSMQIMDRNGFSETISSKERLIKFNHTDFLAPQPYEKVLRVFTRSQEGKTSSCITTYHSNGYPWQYLEIADGRAHGQYTEWHLNGKKRLEAVLIDGLGDVDSLSQQTWVFDKLNKVWNDEGVLIAEIYYENGLLESVSKYYHSNGKLWKEIPYHNNLIQGTVCIYNLSDEIIETFPYEKGQLHGNAKGLNFEETYENGKLITGVYAHDEAKIKEGKGKRVIFEDGKIDSIVEYRDGVPYGQIQVFNELGVLCSTFTIKDGKKNGEEVEYFPNGKQPKFALHWHDDIIQGIEKSWYENGVMESQREMNNNKKHGLSFAWYRDGQLMLMEEYDHDNLIKGTYYKKGDKSPVSMIESGAGIATLFDPDGILLKKINYEKGKPLKNLE
jgi:antitoxin component YwqK of YwqJK toxin-antitoxin module